MFDAQTLINIYSNLIGWKQHFNPADFEIGPALVISESGEYYQQKHPALSLSTIRAIVPDGQTLDNYLDEKVSDSTVEMFNDILQKRQVNQYGKTLLQRAILLNQTGWANDGLVNQGRFVGFQITVKAATGLSVKINEIGLQFQQAEDFDLYLFHTSKEDYIEKFNVTTTGASSWKWQVKELILNSYKSGEYHGGAFVLGYYQDDLAGMAINLSNFNWNQGACGGCNPTAFTQWNSIKRHVHIFPLYVPFGSYVKEKMFNIQEDAFFVSGESFGLNLKLTVECDLTEFFATNRMVFKNLLALKVTHKILYDMKFSQEVNYIEENLKQMVIRDLEGDKETNYLNISQQYDREIKAVAFNIGGINGDCLPCEASASGPTVGMV